MKNLFCILFALISIFYANAQNESIPPTSQDSVPTAALDTIVSPYTPGDSITMYISSLLEDVRMLQEKEVLANRFKLYPTENMYQFLKLDTQTGQIEQIQWNLKEENEFITVINYRDLSSFNDTNSFELYPTQNMYQFLLLDKATGRTWHVQWGLESSKRWIKRIY